MTIKRGVLLSLVVLVLASCRDDEQDSSESFHPAAEYLPSVTDPQFVLREQEADTAAWVDFTKLEGHVIGVDEGTPHTMIGSVWDVAIGTNAVFYVDYESSHVRVYDFLGELQGIIGKRGYGPGEFPQAIAVAVSGLGHAAKLMVGADARQIAMFRPTDSTFVLENTFMAIESFALGDICAMHGHVYTLGWSSDESGGVIHKHTLEGAHVASFGEPYSAPTMFVRGNLANRGVLACNDRYRVIAYSLKRSPFITGFSESGQVLWHVKLGDADMTPVTVSRTADGREKMEFGSMKPDQSSPLEIFGHPGTDSLVVTYHTNEKGATKQHLFKLHAATGLGEYIGWSTWSWQEGANNTRIVGMDATRLYTRRDRPFPQLGIYPRPDAVP